LKAERGRKERERGVICQESSSLTGEKQSILKASSNREARVGKRKREKEGTIAREGPFWKKKKSER